LEYEQKAIEYISEFYDHKSEINSTGGLDSYLKESTYTDWLVKVLKDIDLANIPENRVPALTYFYVREDEDRIVGMINVRLSLNAFLKEEGGHFGYCIRPTERRKGYATNMLREAMGFCKTIGLHSFIATCDKSNAASAGVIKNCGGVLDVEFYSETFKEIIQRYRIK
jgi:predicted acetyltransferase